MNQTGNGTKIGASKNPWLAHVAKFRKDNPTVKNALQEAKKTYSNRPDGGIKRPRKTNLPLPRKDGGKKNPRKTNLPKKQEYLPTSTKDGKLPPGVSQEMYDMYMT
jgi:hypothetical protein